MPKSKYELIYKDLKDKIDRKEYSQMELPQSKKVFHSERNYQ